MTKRERNLTAEEKALIEEMFKHRDEFCLDGHRCKSYKYNLSILVERYPRTYNIVIGPARSFIISFKAGVFYSRYSQMLDDIIDLAYQKMIASESVRKNNQIKKLLENFRIK